MSLKYFYSRVSLFYSVPFLQQFLPLTNTKLLLKTTTFRDAEVMIWKALLKDLTVPKARSEGCAVKYRWHTSKKTGIYRL